MYRLVKSRIAEQRTIGESSINAADCFEARGAEGNITVKLSSRQGNQHWTYHQKKWFESNPGGRQNAGKVKPCLYAPKCGENSSIDWFVERWHVVRTRAPNSDPHTLFHKKSGPIPHVWTKTYILIVLVLSQWLSPLYTHISPLYTHISPSTDWLKHH